MSLIHSLGKCLLCVYWVPDSGPRHQASKSEPKGQDNPLALVERTFQLQPVSTPANMALVPPHHSQYGLVSNKGVKIKQSYKKGTCVWEARGGKQLQCSRKTSKDLCLQVDACGLQSQLSNSPVVWPWARPLPSLSLPSSVKWN